VGGARELLELTASLASDFLDSLDERPVFPGASLEELRASLGSPLPDEPLAPECVVRDLHAAADPGVVAIPSGRYFGFVIGGALPAALAADWLVSAWDQNAGLYVGGPAVAVAEEVAGGWLRDLLRLPEHASFGFVTGCQMAHVTGLAAARHRVLANAGWDVNRDGLAGAPSIRVLCGEKVHVTVPRALRLLGIGASAVVPVEADDQGRMRPDALREALARGSGPTVVCAQAGEVNTGAVDPLPEIAAAGRAAGAWLHLDGAFGLWAAASPRLAHLVEGAELFDSWATDAHKWLNVPYDNGVAFCADPDAHRAAMAIQAAYLVHAEPGAARDQMEWNPEFSRRARGVPVYAALRSLGRSGVATLVEHCCDHARRFASELERVNGVELLNEVVLNQVLFRYETDERTDEILRAVQASGEAWMSGTVWNGRKAIRISVSNWQTSDADVERTLAAFEAAYATEAPAR
jgi:glutamate/tyrosine decarboxylase-like PLP-dependent enzyme